LITNQEVHLITNLQKVKCNRKTRSLRISVSGNKQIAILQYHSITLMRLSTGKSFMTLFNFWFIWLTKKTITINTISRNDLDSTTFLPSSSFSESAKWKRKNAWSASQSSKLKIFNKNWLTKQMRMFISYRAPTNITFIV
jgi:hypothetical protein